MKRCCVATLMALLFFIGDQAAQADLVIGNVEYDQDVTAGVLFGSGNANGSWTRDQTNGIELALRAKVRFPTPLNQFNSNGDGTYSHAAGDFSGRASWNYEFAADVDYLDTSGLTFDDVEVKIGIDTNPGQAVTLTVFDIALFGDNEPFGHDSIAQNSQNLGFLPDPPFTYDFTEDATYDFTLEAFDVNTDALLASTSMQVIVGNGGVAIPEASQITCFFALSTVAGVFVFLRKAGKKKMQPHPIEVRTT